MDYEMHITITPPTDNIMNYDRFTEVAKVMGWKTSMFDHDDVDGIAGKWFITHHAETMSVAAHELVEAKMHLNGHGLLIERLKIEHIVFDTKKGHDIRQLSEDLKHA